MVRRLILSRFLLLPFAKATAEDLSEDAPRYKGTYTPVTLPMTTAMILKLSPYRRSQRILTARTLAEAVKGCDSYAKKVVKGSLSLGYGNVLDSIRHVV